MDSDSTAPNEEDDGNSFFDTTPSNRNSSRLSSTLPLSDGIRDDEESQANLNSVGSGGKRGRPSSNRSIIKNTPNNLGSGKNKNAGSAAQTPEPINYFNYDTTQDSVSLGNVSAINSSTSSMKRGGGNLLSSGGGSASRRVSFSADQKNSLSTSVNDGSDTNNYSNNDYNNDDNDFGDNGESNEYELSLAEETKKTGTSSVNNRR